MKSQLGRPVVSALLTGCLCLGCAHLLDRRPVDRTGADDPLVVALLHKDYRAAVRMLQKGYPVAGRSTFADAPAFWAMARGDSEGLRLLIRFGLDVNHEWGKDGGNLLVNAVQFGNLELVQVLCEAGASPLRDARYSRSPLYCAVVNGREAIERYLRGRGAKFNDWDLEALRLSGQKPR